MKYNFVIKFRLGFFLLCLFLFLLCIVLGIWQLHRYHYKKNLLINYTVRLHKTPKSIAQLASTEQDLKFQPVIDQGNYLNSLTILLQNHYYHGQVGFEVLTPFQIAGEKKLLLVDRGWLFSPRTQEISPTIKPAVASRIIGRIKILNEYQFILGENTNAPTKRPIIMQKININELENMTHHTFFPFIVLLNADQPDALVRDWTITTVLPERHLGYAIQWFVMSLVLLIAYACFCFERVEKK